MSRQRADGTWYSENGIMSTPLAATTWVAIWLPIVLDRLGGVDTELSVSFPANVRMSNPDMAPTNTTVNSDGSTTVLWQMTGVTSAGRTLNYDLSLLDMALNEVRPVSSNAHLTFLNSFTNGVVVAPLDVPRITASDFLDLGVGTDKPGYAADTLVRITAQVNNTGATASDGSVSFDIHAPDGVLVANIGNSLAAVNLAPGNYTTGVQLLDAQGNVLAQSSGSFGVLSTDQSGVGLTGTLQATPATGNTYTLSANVLNQGNADVSNVPLTLSIVDPAAHTRQRHP